MSNNASDNVDVLVIGAGVAGATAALAAARVAGSRRVMLVERAAWPRDKVCGCCLGGRGVAALESAGVKRGELLARGLVLESAEVRCGGQAVKLPLASGDGGAVVIGRVELDGLLVDAAVTAGVEFVPACSARVGARDAGGAWMVTLVDGAGTRLVRAAVVIAADGLSGHALDDVAGMDVRIARASRMGIGAHALWGRVRAINSGEASGQAGADTLPIGKVILCTGRGGYAGLVRLRDGTVDVAAALDPAVVKAAGGPGPVLAEILRGAGLAVDGPWPERFGGTGLLTRRRSCIALPGLLVVGDAAGYVEPFTGEGMTWAACGGRAAGVMAATLSPEDAGAAWARWYGLNVRARQRVCRVIAGGLRVPGCVSVVAWLIGRSAAARGLARAVAVRVSGRGQKIVSQGELA